MDFVAICPVADLLAVNDDLEAQGFGPGNFSVPAYTGQAATHAALHCWTDPVFQAALEAIPEVTIQVGPLPIGVDEQGNAIVSDDPTMRTKALIEAHGAIWGAQAPALPDAGTVAVGYYQADGSLWYVIQAFDRSIYSDPPDQLAPALITRVRHPGAVEEWVQPLYQFGAYALVNPFTGLPDEALHDGKHWRVTAANAAGTNTYQPGVWGWTEVGQDAGDPGTEPGTATWVDTGLTIIAQAGQAYRLSGVPSGLTIGQALRLGPTAETKLKGYWPVLLTPSDYIQIDPFKQVPTGTAVWKWA